MPNRGQEDGWGSDFAEFLGEQQQQPAARAQDAAEEEYAMEEDAGAEQEEEAAAWEEAPARGAQRSSSRGSMFRPKAKAGRPDGRGPNLARRMLLQFGAAGRPSAQERGAAFQVG